MRQFFVTVAGVAVGLLLFVVLAPVLLIGWAVSAASSAPEPVPSQAVLTVDLRRTLQDQSDETGFGIRTNPSVIDIVDALARGSEDPSVRGAFIRANQFGMAPAHAEEIHQALRAFREAGRFVVVHSQGFDGPSATPYLAASAANAIWLQASGAFASSGLAMQTPFFGGVLERFGAEAQFEQFEEYKGGAEVYTRSTFSEANREAQLALLEDVFATTLTRAAEARDVDPADLRSLLEASPYSAEDALSLGLVDRLGHVAEAREAARARAGEDAEFISVVDYLAAAGRPDVSGPVIAVVQGQGAVLNGGGGGSAFRDSAVYGDTIADAIDSVVEDGRARAIVLRISSPGGSPTASDQIHNAVARAQAAGMPVVASFGSVAASGGYYLAAGADAILAQPTTLTGSIGVYGGKIVLRDTFGLVDFNVETLAVGGDFTLAYSSTTPFSPSQRAAYRALMSDVYDDFLRIVAEGRNLSVEQVREIARGRVWTGAQAYERGLIDGLGGYRDAIALAAELAEIPAEQGVRVIRYPEPLSPIEQLEALFSVSAGGLETLGEVEAVLRSPEMRALLEARDASRGDISLRARLPQFD